MDNNISLGKEFDCIAYIYYKGIKYYNIDYRTIDKSDIYLIKLWERGLKWIS